jgi:hypothetical protein
VRGERRKDRAGTRSTAKSKKEPATARDPKGRDVVGAKPDLSAVIWETRSPERVALVKTVFFVQTKLCLARARREIDTKSKALALQRRVRFSFTGETYGPQRSTMR